MAYSSDLADLLTAQLVKLVTLNPHQLAGQVANLDFWIAEVRHCFEVIEGYGVRFERLKGAQEGHVSLHGTVEFHHSPAGVQATKPAPPRRVPDRELRKTRRALADVAYRFLIRCRTEGLI